MFKEVYNRCKTYLNSYVALGTVFALLFFILLPTFTFKEANGFFFILRYAYQYPLTNILVILLYVYNIWNYLHKNINMIYQLHRYSSVKKVIKNNICDVIFIGLILELVFMILNISVAIFYNDGYYLSQHEYYEVTNLVYIIYIFIVRFAFVSIISTLVYFIYYTDSKCLKIFCALLISFNLLKFNNAFPFSMNTILSGYEFDSFFNEIISVLIVICIYIICLLLIKRKFINKKRDIG